MLLQGPVHRLRYSPRSQKPCHYSLRCLAEAQTPAKTSITRNVTLPVANPEGADFSLVVQVPAGADVFQVSLKKPLGLTLTERSGIILVDEVSPGGHAAAAGVTAGDTLVATTARSQVPDAAPGVTQLVLLPTAGQSFKTVAAALRSNTCSQCLITLVLQRQQQQQQQPAEVEQE